MPRKTKAKDEEEDISVDEAPTSINPYEVLGLAQDATQSQVNSAYRKAALKCHPDKVSAEDKDSAHAKFQEVAFAYAILSDEKRRKRYDTTGRTEESLDLDDDDFDWQAFFREQYHDVVTAEKINNFAQEYKGSKEEEEHLLAAYEKCQGDMNKIYEHVMLSDPVEDDERFLNIIYDAISRGDVEAYDKYTEESDKSRKSRIARARKKRDKEAREAEKAAAKVEGKASTKSKSKSKKEADTNDLAALIQQRQQSRSNNAESFFDRLEAKYATEDQDKKGSKKRSNDDLEPPEEAFEKNQKLGKGKDAVAGAGRSKRSRN